MNFKINQQKKKLNEQITIINFFVLQQVTNFLTNNKINPKPDDSDESIDCDNVQIKADIRKKSFKQ